MHPTKILIEYGIIENLNKGHGWLPITYEDGCQQGNTYSSWGYDKDVALEQAKLAAQELADHFIGDWEITIQARASK
jgi:hypothetical protein